MNELMYKSHRKELATIYIEARKEFEESSNEELDLVRDRLAEGRGTLFGLSEHQELFERIVRFTLLEND